jgi:hypothetical protein
MSERSRASLVPQPRDAVLVSRGPAAQRERRQSTPPELLTRRAAGTGGIVPPHVMAARLTQLSGERRSGARHALLEIQRQYGNRYVQGMMASSPQASDRYEQEADRVARHVSSPTARSGQPRQGSGADPTAVQRQPAVQRVHRAAGGAVDTATQQTLAQARGGGQGIPAYVRAPVEQTLETDFRGVRVHTDSRADQLAQSLQARAFTAGRDIFFRRGEYTPGNAKGKSLLAHELTHVVQQRGGAVLQRKLIDQTCTQAMQRPLDVNQGREWSFRLQLMDSLSDYFRRIVEPEYDKHKSFAGVRHSYEKFVTERQQAGEQFAQGGRSSEETNALAKKCVDGMIQALDTLVARLNTVTVMADTARSLKDRMTTAIRQYQFTIDEVRPYIEAEPQSERDKVWKDKTLMAEAQRGLDLDTYLALLPALRVLNPPTSKIKEATGKWTSHLSAEDADNYIRPYLRTLGVTASAIAGRKVAGEVSIVDDADWDLAFKRQWGTTYPTTKANAFVDVDVSKTPQRHIWIHKDRGNAGTIIHEGMHKYADATLRDAFIKAYHPSDPISRLDEGITEYFTRNITTPLGISRGNYAKHFEVATRLVRVLGEKLVADSYFEGKLAELEKRYQTVIGGTWDAFGKAVEAEDWTTALSYL